MTYTTGNAYSWASGIQYRRPIKKISKTTQWKDSAPVVDIVEYDINGRETYHKIGNFEEWTEYDDYGNITVYKNTSGGGYSATYDHEGNVLRVEYENGYIEETEYEYGPHVVNIPSVWTTQENSEGQQYTLSFTMPEA